MLIFLLIVASLDLRTKRSFCPSCTVLSHQSSKQILCDVRFNLTKPFSQRCTSAVGIAMPSCACNASFSGTMVRALRCLGCSSMCRAVPNALQNSTAGEHSEDLLPVSEQRKC